MLFRSKILRPDCGYNVKSKSKDKTITDTGIDIIQIDSETECTLVQCKNGYKKGLRFQDLAGFWGWMLLMEDKKGVVYYTNKLSKNIIMLSQNPRIQYVKQAFDVEIKKADDKVVSLDKIPKTVILEIWDYCLELASEYLDIHQKLPDFFHNDNDGYNNKFLAEWIADAMIDYNNSTNIMTLESFRNKWTNFFTKYYKIFRPDDNVMNEMDTYLNKCKYCSTHFINKYLLFIHYLITCKSIPLEIKNKLIEEHTVIKQQPIINLKTKDKDKETKTIKPTEKIKDINPTTKPKLLKIASQLQKPKLLKK